MMPRQATAPYNFVSLPPKVLSAPFDGGAESDEERQENYRRHVLSQGKLSGYICLSIKTMTSIFVGNGGSEFFSPNGVPVIPGSSIRGMVKNIFKIVTCGAMRGNKEDADFNDKHLYFRAMAAKKNSDAKKCYLRDVYTSRVKKENVQAGFLIHNKVENQYYMVYTDFQEIDVRAGEISRKPPGINWESDGGVATYTGPMPRKHHYTIHSVPNWSQKVLVEQEVIEAYKTDETRKGVDLFDQKYCKRNNEAADFTGDDEIDFVAPCFFVEENGQIGHFGFGRFYRIPYKQSIGMAVPKGLQTDVIDYTDALFGRKELWGSRLSFENAVCTSGRAAQENPAYAKILSNPKPTSFQLYLHQDDPKQIKHWDSNGACIRGYKMYWHKKMSWVNPEQKETNMCLHPIQPVKPGQVFQSRIRFERLSRDELGALLKVFELSRKDEELCFKIGQGKSIGLGSIRVEATLQLDGDSYYRQLFDDSGQWHTAETMADFSEYVAEFEEKLKSGLSKEDYHRYQIAQGELSHLLDWKNTSAPDWNDKTAAMDINDPEGPFQNRLILPLAREVK
ncbi:TIGR03986 family CRISPR-associated RAMP protein [Selenomonas sp. KH1T6]|uniref:TIGR03986 family type III CRISPR-associated RAMP protein n=1 Tax=Selenomonas sp. KH1T6 TaxID=3158784 RepID=UPI0008A72F75|nr:CRISPR-associated protein [Selenomonas ruminantium]